MNNTQNKTKTLAHSKPGLLGWWRWTKKNKNNAQPCRTVLLCPCFCSSNLGKQFLLAKKKKANLIKGTNNKLSQLNTIKMFPHKRQSIKWQDKNKSSLARKLSMGVCSPMWVTRLRSGRCWLGKGHILRALCGVSDWTSASGQNSAFLLVSSTSTHPLVHRSSQHIDICVFWRQSARQQFSMALWNATTLLTTSKFNIHIN